VSLTQLATSVRQGRVRSQALVTASLERIDRLDGPVNAVISTRGDDALADAAAIDARIVAGDDPGPLAGLPLLVKDNEDCAGLPTTFGSLLYRDAGPALRDSEVVARLRAAGAIVVGKTNLPEFALEGFTANRSFGDTHNPWALDWSPGGSSGGSGAALAMGLAPLATASDGGGSIRIPAAYCGLVGHKPTNGIIGRDPIPSWIDLSTKGPLATSVADASLLLDVLRGPLAGDPTALPSWDAREGAWPRRVLVTPRLADHGPLPEAIAGSFEEAIGALEIATGISVERIDPPLEPQADEDWFTLAGVDELTWIGRDVVTERAADLSGHLRAALELAATFTVDDYLAARRRRFGYVKVIDQLVGDDAVLVCPTMCVEGFYADGRMVGREETGTDASANNTQIGNMTGHPALSLPAGRSPNGVPFGIQITGPRFADDMVLAVGAAWEAAQPWPVTAPGFEPFGIGLG
jgi:Asp-tRNA(Asn)/Glu-tRNA(Gln) amidotransferase A subunit family amidase